ncbi:methyl-accepting chemotaxis protein [Paucibacter sp. DJ2R-2]|uniref:methyl-accepting chemotaxis protein n=1 Tax=Paucibacter sp. DJ2R-2 TaxID=2893558 RepID=UPI0021E47F38|nr:methyl-accepting chemotaxis protein [Paucibacter sp. DJ2R-2]MCV2420443.1 methyl-accepting chemotaxis protein [Paucibacter sp. DJ4R-1]MCV2439621.1 methyl-accepting chemotaxis protein [Paucibacter sp. DJ2R-2]
MKLNLAQRIVASNVTLLIMFLLILSTVMWLMSRMDTINDDIIDNNIPQLTALSALNDSINGRGIALRNLGLLPEAKHENEIQALAKLRTQGTAAMAELEKQFVPGDASAEEINKVKAILAKNQASRALVDELVALIQAGKREAYVELLYSRYDGLEDELLKELDEISTQMEEAARKDGATAADAYDEARYTALAGLVLSILVASGLGYALRRFVIQRLGADPTDLAEIAQRIASGDLRALEHRGVTFQGSVVHAMATMQQSLASLVRAVGTNVVSMAHASEEIAHASHDLSTRTEQQAANLEQVAATAQELNSSVQRTSTSAHEAHQLSTATSQAADAGGTAVGKVVSTMEQIQASSRQIGEISSVIDGIAFQTNILALNAAVEAARAGEQGRGFAVVASEVRSLAQRSAEASKQIGALIRRSTEAVNDGAGLVDKARQTMEDLRGSVQQVQHMISDISRATQDQATSLGEVSQAIRQLDEMTQQNAAMVEETTASSDNLRSMGAELKSHVERFQV